MLVEEQTIEVKWTAKQKRYYEDKGYVFSKFGDSFFIKVSDLPTTSSKKVNVKCDYCGKDYYISYQKYCIIKNSNNPKIACKGCAGKKLSESTLNNRRKKHYTKLKDICNKKGYTLLTNIKDIYGLDSDIAYICPKHGEQHTKLECIFSGHGCFKCGREIALHKQHKRTLNYRQSILYENAIHSCNKKGYTFLSDKEDIVNNTSVVKYLCPVHGEQSMRINNLITGKGCPKCSDELKSISFKLDSDAVEKRINSLGGVLLNKEEYRNINEKNLKIVCPNCKNVFITSLNNFTQHGGQVCNQCKGVESNGERRIRTFLEDNSIVFEQEKWFSDCRDIKPLPFDFYIPKFNLIIEFDGRQHFEDTGLFTYSLEQTKKHDKIKNDYCEFHNIKLLRIPYWKYNDIDIILNNELNSHEDIVSSHMKV